MTFFTGFQWDINLVGIEGMSQVLSASVCVCVCARGTHQQHRHQDCAACGTLRWFRTTGLPGRSTLPPAGSRCSPGLTPHQGPAAAARGHRRQTCRGSGHQT